MGHQPRISIEQDAYARHLKIELVELKEGYARARMPIEPTHMNSFGMVHGGAIFSLADYVFQAASNSHGVLSVAIQASIFYLQAPRSRVLEAEATEVSRTQRLASYSIRVLEDADRLVATFQGMVYRMPGKTPAPAESRA